MDMEIAKVSESTRANTAVAALIPNTESHDLDPFKSPSGFSVLAHHLFVKIPQEDHEFSTHAVTTNKNFKYLKDCYNIEDKGTIDDNNVVEVEMIEKIRHNILGSKLGFIAALHQIAKWLQGALRHTWTAIKLTQAQIQYVSSLDSLGGMFCVIDMNYI
ncbi:hypothetical protein L195_g013208 [Trifolium pratense]|uniref:Uncharacterized protein n=1 Tax=Trifolium pratense TaxID=57577 RepID=A0A2K3PMH6_TRIPR|nr:hypothetical protein L195_g013208 [Trifolium pratense]